MWKEKDDLVKNYNWWISIGASEVKLRKILNEGHTKFSELILTTFKYLRTHDDDYSSPQLVEWYRKALKNFGLPADSDSIEGFLLVRFINSEIAHFMTAPSRSLDYDLVSIVKEKPEFMEKIRKKDPLFILALLRVTRSFPHIYTHYPSHYLLPSSRYFIPV